MLHDQVALLTVTSTAIAVRTFRVPFKFYKSRLFLEVTGNLEGLVKLVAWRSSVVRY